MRENERHRDILSYASVDHKAKGEILDILKADEVVSTLLLSTRGGYVPPVPSGSYAYDTPHVHILHPV